MNERKCEALVRRTKRCQKPAIDEHMGHWFCLTCYWNETRLRMIGLTTTTTDHALSEGE